MVTIMFLGVLIGNLLSGSLGDNYGRRIVIIVSCVGIIVFTIISSFAQSAITLTAARLFVGAALGIGQPGIYSLASELTPIWWRFASSSVWQSSYCCGALYSALLLLYDDPDLQHLHWRWLLRMGTIPAAACLIMSMFFLYQSPSFLATNGHYDEAVKVLDAMKWFNSASSVSSEFTPPHQMLTVPCGRTLGSKHPLFWGTRCCGQRLLRCFHVSLPISYILAACTHFHCCCPMSSDTPVQLLHCLLADYGNSWATCWV